jgi:hypothetical protein
MQTIDTWSGNKHSIDRYDKHYHTKHFFYIIYMFGDV